MRRGIVHAGRPSSAPVAVSEEHGLGRTWIHMLPASCTHLRSSGASRAWHVMSYMDNRFRVFWIRNTTLKDKHKVELLKDCGTAGSTPRDRPCGPRALHVAVHRRGAARPPRPRPRLARPSPLTPSPPLQALLERCVAKSDEPDRAAAAVCGAKLWGRRPRPFVCGGEGEKGKRGEGAPAERVHM